MRAPLTLIGGHAQAPPIQVRGRIAQHQGVVIKKPPDDGRLKGYH